MPKPIQWTPAIVPNGGINEAQSSTQIGDNQWTEGSNSEPLVDSVRMRRGTAGDNAAPLQAINLFSESGTDQRTFTNGTSEYIAQEFTVGATALWVDTIAVRLRKDSGSPPSTVLAAVYSDDASDQPDTAVTGLDFGQSSPLTAVNTTDEFLWYRFTFTTKTQLSAATKYHVVIRHLGAAASNEIAIEEDTTGNPYAGGQLNRSTDGSTWVAVPAADANFRIYADYGSITGIYDYRLSDASTSRHLVFHDQELYKNVSGTMTQLSDRDRTAFTTGADVYPSFVTGQDRCFIAHGTTDTVSKKFYVLSGTEYFENEGISPPTAVLSALDNGTSDPPDADTYTFDYFYWNNDLGIASRRKYNGVSAFPHTANGTNDVDITIPADVIREGDRATHIRLEVKGPADAVFKFWTEIAIGTTTATFTKTLYEARSTEAEYDDNVPSQHTMKVVAENRQFISGNATDPDKVWFSKIRAGTSFYESFPTNNFRQFGKHGDWVTALFFMNPNVVIVGMKNNIYAIDARRPGTSDIAVVARGIGVAGLNAGLVVGRNFFFVSDADKNKGMYVWPGSGLPLPVRGVDDTFKGLNQTRLQYASCAHLATDNERYQWLTLLSNAAATSAKTLLGYDYGLKAWFQYDYDADLRVLGEVAESSVNKVFIGRDDGVEAESDTGTTDLVAAGIHTGSDDAAVLTDANAAFGTLIGYTVNNVTDGSSATITANTATTITGTLSDGTDDNWDAADDYTVTGPLNPMYRMKAFDFGDQAMIKKLRFVDYTAERKATGSITCAIEADFGDRDGTTANLTYPVTGSLFTLGTDALGGTSLMGSTNSNATGRVRARVVARYLQPRLSSEADFKLKTIAFGVQPTGRMS